MIDQILTLLADCVSLVHAQIATMGGAGLEYERWRSLHIPPTHCWLVEHDPASARKLRHAYPLANHVRALADLPTAVHKANDNQARLDMFHLDLCGTVEPSIRDLTNILPLLLNGKGRILAVTMADQRGNRSLNEPKLVQRICARLFGSHWNELWSNLVDLHSQEPVIREGVRADPEKVALREAGALLYLLLAFSAIRREGARYEARKERYPLMHFLRFRERGERRYLKLMQQGSVITLPSHVERYVYWSDESNFRMRTLLFRLQTHNEPMDMAEAAAMLAKVMLKAPFSIVHGDEIASIWHQQVRETSHLPARTSAVVDQTSAHPNPTSEHPNPQEEHVTEPTPNNAATIAGIRQRFAPFLGALNSELRADFDRLCDLAGTSGAMPADVHAHLKHMRAAVDALAEAVGPAPDTAQPVAGQGKQPRASKRETPATPAARAAPAPKRKINLSRAIGMHINGHVVPLKQTDEHRLNLLRARHKGPLDYRTAQDTILTLYGVKPDGPGRRTLGSLIAGTAARFRPGFIARLLKDLPADQHESLLTELATLYSMPVKKLRTEAKEIASRLTD
ncbi:hypothetical protein A3E39_02290 [Candidatus Uhrbacteria bacterium RIFCSPHIGHO2_12_FULL_60_25]|uniref:Uncharacterized protein n=1 Tax=Candidatus Uhrbacteria bacterium RIFCSPHIGHO2_12_FULL_60_25 TaxID=1802399 RepID=A0A1F7UL96_9BACT|nr:MAG: hypothetical protein A3D73_03660 [Candidatus Uhrbacteria bacterium RIFCSPHIGHO2_02_FULL_60_44]OGL79052.1 MAG: hypothetical protein A3E39_02290 [Candidatus Uhrbacteria bacterium RIFCSPHIGHO2_12_FULL_60_25]